MASPSTRRLIICTAVPASVGLIFLLVVSAFVYGHAFRPGLYAEVGLVIYLTLLLLAFQRRKVRGALTVTLLLLAFYGAGLVKFLMLREGIELADLAGLDELFSILSVWQQVAIALTAAVFVVLLVSNLRWPRTGLAMLLPVPVVGYFIGSWLAPAGTRAVFEWIRPTSLIVELEAWRDGPLFSLARQLPRTRAARLFLTAPVAGDESAELWRREQALADLPPPQRNLHFLLLESFVDPLHFRAFDCGFDPVDPRFRRWLDESDSVALAATFGGKSARSEFEILCGVPAYERLGIDFMTFSGAEVPCLPSLLRRLGYMTMSSSSGNSSFFNHDTAFTAMGFARRYFEPDFVIGEDDRDGEMMSDEPYYAQMLRRILPAIATGQPLMTYVLTWAGHYPFELHPERHPPVCPDDTLVGKAVNCAYYSSRAAADYIEQLEAHDPQALIVVMSDHLPSLGFGHAGYREFNYRLRFGGRDAPAFWAEDEPSWLESRATPLFARMAGAPVSLGILPHYLVHEAVLDLLTEGAYCRTAQCLRGTPVNNRPNGMRPVFTTADEFPRSICAGDTEEGALCAEGRRLQRRLEAEYEALLRQGLREEGAPHAAP